MPQELIKDGHLDREAAADALRQFLETTVREAGFQLKVTVRAIAPGMPGADAEVIADLDGRDKELLLERGAELLKALEHLAFRALRLEPAFHEKIHLDCGGYRALRFEELRMTARVAAERVQSLEAAVSLESDVFARTPHRASDVERNARRSHRERRRRRRTPSRDSSRRRRPRRAAKLLYELSPPRLRRLLLAQPCDKTFPVAPNRTRYVNDAGRSGRTCGKRKSEISTIASLPSLWKRVTGKRENHRTVCTSRKLLRGFDVGIRRSVRIEAVLDRKSDLRNPRRSGLGLIGVSPKSTRVS